MELSTAQAELLAGMRRAPQDALALLSVDMADPDCSLEAIVTEVAARRVALVSIVNTGLNSGVPRRGSAWPQFNHIRHDGASGGLVLHHHCQLRVEELLELASSTFPGLWVTVASGPVGADRRERVTVVGILPCGQQAGGLEDHLAECLAKARKRFGPEVPVVVGGNQSFALTEASPAGLQGLVSADSAPGTFLLHSPALPLVPEAVPGLGRGALLCRLRPTGCSVCNLGFHSDAELVEHRARPEHRRNLVLASFRQQLPAATKSPHPLGLELAVVAEEPGVVQEPGGPVEVTMEPGVRRTFALRLRNGREPVGDLGEGIVVSQVAVPDGSDVLTLSDEHGVTGDDEDTKIRIRFSKRYKINVSCFSREVGEHKIPVVIVFYHDTFSEVAPGPDGDKLASLLVAEVLVRVHTAEVVAMLPVEPYVAPLRRVEQWRAKETVKGQLPPAVFQEEADYLTARLPLGHYPLGETRTRLIATRFQGGGDTVEEQELLQKTRGLLDTELDADNYAERFQLLLHCEQFQEQRDVRHFDMAGVELRLEPSSGLVVLEVAGLQEGRPSVLRGDKLYLREAGSNRMVEYEAFVHQVGETDVWLGCGDRLVAKLQPGAAWDVRFAVTLHPAKHMHRAVRLAKSLQLTTGLLFPVVGSLSPGAIQPDLDCYSPLVAANPEQRAAVQNIVAGVAGTAPYVVFGPPGTGKTVTLVEAIKQVWLHHPDSHILATAPSNTAADLLAERLLEDIPGNEMLRLHANSRKRISVPSSIEKVSNFRDDGFTFPCITTLAGYRVIVTTLVTAGRLVSAQFPEAHFQHIFIDEAGQATEPETVIALAGLVAAQSLESGGQVVMAGDPWQLGPIVRSSVASDHGLATSLLERLMALPLYSRGDAGYDVRCITKLVRNFRSHPALLRLPGRLFYADELVPCADRSIVDALLQFSGLTEQGKGRVPLLVHGVVGQDMRESTSPSFFNPVEAALVLDYVGQLVEREGVRPSDIGVIAPYRQQVNKLREALGRRGLRQEVMVGTTEEFQGQERLVIIVSTVRSSPEYLVADSEHRLGFLANPKRFNVAITRARGLLIVIGNPHILERDPDWRELLEYALGLGCYRGVPFPRLQQPEEQEKLSRLLLDQGELLRLEETGWNPKAV